MYRSVAGEVQHADVVKRMALDRVAGHAGTGGHVTDLEPCTYDVPVVPALECPEPGVSRARAVVVIIHGSHRAAPCRSRPSCLILVTPAPRPGSWRLTGVQGRKQCPVHARTSLKRACPGGSFKGPLSHPYCTRTRRGIQCQIRFRTGPEPSLRFTLNCGGIWCIMAT